MDMMRRASLRRAERCVVASVVLAVVLGVGRSSASAQDADTVLVNGKILTVDAQSSTREALAVRGGAIVAVGRSADVRKLAGAKTRVIDLQGIQQNSVVMHYRVSTDCGTSWTHENTRVQGSKAKPAIEWFTKLLNFSEIDEHVLRAGD